MVLLHRNLKIRYPYQSLKSIWGGKRLSKIPRSKTFTLSNQVFVWQSLLSHWIPKDLVKNKNSWVIPRSCKSMWLFMPWLGVMQVYLYHLCILQCATSYQFFADERKPPPDIFCQARTGFFSIHCVQTIKQNWEMSSRVLAHCLASKFQPGNLCQSNFELFPGKWQAHQQPELPWSACSAVLQADTAIC